MGNFIVNAFSTAWPKDFFRSSVLSVFKLLFHYLQIYAYCIYSIVQKSLATLISLDFVGKTGNGCEEVCKRTW